MIELYEGQVVAGKYRLARLLARGGMGSVWAAQHLKLEVPVAIKFMDPSLAASADARGRFEREAKAAAQLRTPHVVQMHDHGVDGETPYIVMELLQGEDLGARLRREKRLSLPATSKILTQAAKALRLAHDAGIVHRDLKPGNIFLARNDDDDEVVKILDFGIAKAGTGSTIGETTKTGELLGSPDYMSPEQARGSKAVDGRSDLWSLAVILFRVLTGVKVFKGESLGDVIVKICVEPIPAPSSFSPDLPPEIDHFFERALARDPAARFQTAREMAAEFAVAAGGSTWAMPPSREGLFAQFEGSAETRSVPPPRVEPLHDVPPIGVTGSVGAVSMTDSARPSSPGTLTNASLVTPPGGRLRSPVVLWGIGAGVFSIVLATGIWAISRSPSTAAGPASSAIPDQAPGPTATAVVAAAAEPTPPPAPEPPPTATAAPSAAAEAAAAQPPSTSKARARPAETVRPTATATATTPHVPAAAASAKKKPNFGY